MTNSILIFSGAAGSGKGTVLKLVLEKCPKMKLSLSMTTRTPRPGEINGREYAFVTRERFRNVLSEDGFLEHTEYCGNLYGTPKKQFFEMQKDGFLPVLEIETDGAEQIMEKLDSFTSVFLAPPDFETLEARLRERGTETEESIQNRLRAAREEVSRSSQYQYIVVNPDGKAAAAADAIIEICEKGTTENPVLVKDREKFLAAFMNNSGNDNQK